VTTSDINLAVVCRAKPVFVRRVDMAGNAFAILTRVEFALQAAGWTEVERIAFRHEATADGNLDGVMRTAMRYCAVR
jgi:hypothetical protein